MLKSSYIHYSSLSSLHCNVLGLHLYNDYEKFWACSFPGKSFQSVIWRNCRILWNADWLRVRGPSVLTEPWRPALRCCESSMFSHEVFVGRAQVDFTCPGTCVQWHLPLWLTLSGACLRRDSDAPVSHRIIGNRGRCGFRNSLCLPSSIVVIVLFRPISSYYSIF